jgi:sugar/nucleoside kinase (ribokinase family)
VPEPDQTVSTLDVVCLGNALVDVLAHTTDEALGSLGLVKGSMALVDSDAALEIYGSMQNTVEVSGGSAANTAAGVAALGGAAGYIGNVSDDDLGKFFVHDMSVVGVELSRQMSAGTSTAGTSTAGTSTAGTSTAGTGTADGPGTGRSMVLVTPDGERTMATYLGAATVLAPDGLDTDLVSRAQIVYVEGYLWDSEPAKESVRRAIAEAHAANGLVALSASDPFCVERHRRDFLSLLQDDLDLLFCNEDEANLLFGSTSLAQALDSLSETGLLAAVTRGAAGSVIVTPDGIVEIPAEPVEEVVDTTGAGDLYAAGFLYGLTHGRDPLASAKLAGACAAEVISHLGARPQADLTAFTADPRLA